MSTVYFYKLKSFRTFGGTNRHTYLAFMAFRPPLCRRMVITKACVQAYHHQSKQHCTRQKMTSQAASSLLAVLNVGNTFGKMVYTGWIRDAKPISQL